MGRGPWIGVVLGASLGLAGCELQEVTLAEPEALLVAEVYISVGDGEDQVTGFLHSTLGTEDLTDLETASVILTVEDTLVVRLAPAIAAECLVAELENVVAGACFNMSGPAEGLFQPGDRVVVEVSTRDGRELRGATTLPEDFRFLRPGRPGTCALGPGRNLPMVWSRSEGAWAYAAETNIWGLRDGLAHQGIEVEADSIALLGLAVSESDTTIAFPAEFGVFNRFDLERDVATALQVGLPKGTVADVAVAALDRNYVNWVRGGAFNPSGPVRVPSLVGDGTGVIASVVRKVVRILGADPVFLPGSVIPSCFSG
jgi:hypothetical protein